MGKFDGFMIYERVSNPSIDVSKRITNFNEFHPQLNDEERKCQAARCMNCGVPMCQSALKLNGMVTGCPLHNLIPEWNDALFNGHLEIAADRLFKTASFPEFTGRVCPALCEKACNCTSASGNGEKSKNPFDSPDTVSIRENELYIIEKAFETGYLKPRIPKSRTDKKIAVIGSGPAGLAAADYLNRRGHNVTVYEREDRIGGLLMYGIPNMKLDKKIVDRRIDLMKKEGVNFITNADVGKNIKAQEITSSYDAVILACGAKKARTLNVKNDNAQGVLFAVDFLTFVTKSLLNSNFEDKKFFDVKGKNVIVVGGGDTGNDCTGTCIRLGAASVTQLEMMPCPPKERTDNNPWPQWPRTLKTDYGQEEAIYKFGSDPRVYETTIKEILTDKNKVTGIVTVKVKWEFTDGKRIMKFVEGSEKTLKADLILIAAGFTGCEDYSAKAFNTPLSQRGVVLSQNEKYATGIPKIYTAGDMHRGQSLVVWAIYEGRSCAQEVDADLMH